MNFFFMAIKNRKLHKKLNYKLSGTLKEVTDHEMNSAVGWRNDQKNTFDFAANSENVKLFHFF